MERLQTGGMRGPRRTIQVVLAIVAIVAGAATTRAQGKVDVTGKWMLEVNTEAGGTTTPSVTLRAAGGEPERPRLVRDPRRRRGQGHDQGAEHHVLADRQRARPVGRGDLHGDRRGQLDEGQD